MVAGLLPFAEDAQCAMAALDPEVLDVGGARLAHPQTVEAEQHGERGVVAVAVLGGEQEHAELRTIQTSRVRRVDLRPADVLGRVRGDATVDVGEAVEAAHRRQPTVDRRRRQVPLLHPAPVQLDMRTRRRQHDEPVVDAHWKKPRKSWRYASNVRPL